MGDLSRLLIVTNNKSVDIDKVKARGWNAWNRWFDLILLVVVVVVVVYLSPWWQKAEMNTIHQLQPTRRWD